MTLRVERVDGAHFYVYRRIGRHGQRMIETKIPQVSVAFTSGSVSPLATAIFVDDRSLKENLNLS